MANTKATTTFANIFINNKATGKLKSTTINV